MDLVLNSYIDDQLYESSNTFKTGSCDLGFNFDISDKCPVGSVINGCGTCSIAEIYDERNRQNLNCQNYGGDPAKGDKKTGQQYRGAPDIFGFLC